MTEIYKTINQINPAYMWTLHCMDITITFGRHCNCMQLTCIDSTLSLAMRFKIWKLVIVFVACLDKQLVKRMQLLTCFSSFSLGRAIAKFDFYWLYYFGNSLVITI